MGYFGTLPTALCRCRFYLHNIPDNPESAGSVSILKAGGWKFEIPELTMVSVAGSEGNTK